MTGFIVPNPLVSRGKPVFASTGPLALDPGRRRFTQSWNAGVPSAAEPAWVAIQVAPGPSRVLVNWRAAGNDYADARQAPAEYRIESSASSSNGADGIWRVEATVTGNAQRSRAQDVEFDGQSWVRLVLTCAVDAASGVSIDAMDVHDASDGTDDTWFFLGDGTAVSSAPGASAAPPTFADYIHAEYPGYYPAIIDGSIDAELSADGLARLGMLLAHNPDFRHFAVSYGAGDARSGRVSVAQFRANLQAIIEQLLAAGRVPWLARIPNSSEPSLAGVPDYNRVIDDLTRENQLLVGPDLYAWFQARSDQLPASPAGCAAIHRLWAEAADSLYAPQ